MPTAPRQIRCSLVAVWHWPRRIRADILVAMLFAYVLSAPMFWYAKRRWDLSADIVGVLTACYTPAELARKWPVINAIHEWEFSALESVFGDVRLHLDLSRLVPMDSAKSKSQDEDVGDPELARE